MAAAEVMTAIDRRRIYQTATSTAAIDVAGLALAYGAQLVLARWLGARDYGIYAWIVNAAFFLTVPLLFGLPVRMLRDATRDRIATDPAASGGLLRRAYQIPLTLTAVALAVGAAILWSAREQASYPAAGIAGLCALPFLICIALNTSLGRALGRVVAIKAFDGLVRPLLLLSAAAAALAIGIRPSATLAISAFTVIAAGVALAQGVVLLRALPPILRATAPVFHTRSWMIGAAPFALVAGIDVLLRQTDVLMLGYYVEPAEVGVYAVAARISSLVTLPLMAVNMIAASTYADLHAEGDHAGLQDLVGRLALAMFWPSLALLTGLIIAGAPLLGLFGPLFENGYGPMLVLAGAGLINVGAGSVGYLANMTGHQWSAVRVQGAAALGNVVLNAALIPVFGLWGAAIATAVSVIVSNCALHWLVSRKVGVHASIVHALRAKR